MAATPGPATRLRARRPLALLVALFLGLGAVGTATGAALGAVGAASDGPQVGHGHHDGTDDAQRFPRIGR
jgi:hypothetical protein